MSDLVGKPKERFSRVAALLTEFIHAILDVLEIPGSLGRPVRPSCFGEQCRCFDTPYTFIHVSAKVQSTHSLGLHDKAILTLTRLSGSYNVLNDCLGVQT